MPKKNSYKKKLETLSDREKAREASELKELQKRFKKNPLSFLHAIKKLKEAVNDMNSMDLYSVPMVRHKHMDLANIENKLDEVSEFFLYEPDDEE